LARAANTLGGHYTIGLRQRFYPRAKFNSGAARPRRTVREFAKPHSLSLWRKAAKGRLQGQPAMPLELFALHRL
jgi:hypothetical protein